MSTDDGWRVCQVGAMQPHLWNRLTQALKTIPPPTGDPPRECCPNHGGFRPICESEQCYRASPHWVGEYACEKSDVWVCPEGTPVDQRCTKMGNRGGHHFRGCLCPGDPSRGVLRLVP